MTSKNKNKINPKDIINMMLIEAIILITILYWYSTSFVPSSQIISQSIVRNNIIRDTNEPSLDKK